MPLLLSRLSVDMIIALTSQLCFFRGKRERRVQPG